MSRPDPTRNTRQASLRARRRAAGLVNLNLWLTPDQAEAVRAYLDQGIGLPMAPRTVTSNAPSEPELARLRAGEQAFFQSWEKLLEDWKQDRAEWGAVVLVDLFEPVADAFVPLRRRRDTLDAAEAAPAPPEPAPAKPVRRKPAKTETAPAKPVRRKPAKTETAPAKPVNRAELLRAIGRNTGYHDYLWLYEAIRRLFLGAVEIETGHYKIGTQPRVRALHLIDSFDYDPEVGTYFFRIDPRIVALFSRQEFALIDWEKRLQIENRVDLAKRLQRLVVTNDETTQRYSLTYLKDLCCHSGRMRDFKPALLEALRELQRLGLIARPRIDRNTRGGEQVVLERVGVYRGGLHPSA